MGDRSIAENGVSMAVDLGGVRMQNPVNTTSVTVGTANFYDPSCAARIVEGLASWAAEQGVSDINELIGAFEC